MIENVSKTCIKCLCVCVQSLQTVEEVEAYMERLKESVSTTEEVLHRTTAPNLKALEKMRGVKDKLQGVTDGIYEVFHFKVTTLFIF